jgi:NAD(P)-dependent dehydrogenase (short-subunit alcohol dehydrogenase family)
MAQRLKGKAAVVTGGGNGIGRGISIALAEEGAKVVVNDIARGDADKVVGEITKAKGTAVANYDSADSVAAGENIIKTATSNFGRIDILVNCAGNFYYNPAVEMTEEIWDSIMSVHLKGYFSCVKAALPSMVKQKSGRIINFSSIASFFGPGNPAYSTAKAGILGFTSSLAGELKEYGITANAILPSAVTKLFPNDQRKGFLDDHMPVSPCLDPDYVAPMVTYLVTDEAQAITGKFFHVSGGDIGIYAKPLQLPGEAHMFTRKIGKWTVDELCEVIPELLGTS